MSENPSNFFVQFAQDALEHIEDLWYFIDESIIIKRYTFWQEKEWVRNGGVS